MPKKAAKKQKQPTVTTAPAVGTVNAAGVNLWLLLAIAGALALVCSLVGFGGALTVVYLTKPAASAVATPTVAPAATPTPGLATIASIAAANPSVAKEAGAAWRDFAAVVRNPTTPIATSTDLRASIKRFEQGLFVGSPLAGALPGFSAAFNSHLESRLGLEDLPFDAAKRQASADALDEVARALGVR